MDPVASLYGKNHLFEEVSCTSEKVFVPLTVGGGIRTIDDVTMALASGADKVAVNTAFHLRPKFIEEIALTFGSQCCVCSIEAKRVGDNRWEAYMDNGREPTGVSVNEWIKRVTELGAGELLITSVDQEGTKRGFDLKLYEIARDNCSVPIIASGGAGSVEHLMQLRKQGCVSGVAVAAILHYNVASIQNIKEVIT
jgi:cyclase